MEFRDAALEDRKDRSDIEIQNVHLLDQVCNAFGLD